ncbi:hypothetical protein [Paenibacillus sp. Y412MC10]|uniref:hypothetical protein n=1 Tax=Geobacillus sp. (strain Y412MC10) TaxID=481743 RepID=UPI0011A9E9B7|nr:hypothetical protein [Paenibacillus sp. Y412MC10]
MELTQTLDYQGICFYFVGIEDDSRIYKSLDELHHHKIMTALADYDGALIGSVDEVFREDEDDDMIRYFDSVTGKEE